MTRRDIWLAALTLAVLGEGFPARADLVVPQDRVVMVAGAVVDYETGDPIPGAEISLGSGSSWTEARGSRTADGEGRFSFQDVPAGAYHLHVTSDHHREMVDTLEVSGDRNLDLVLRLSMEAIHLEPLVKAPEAPRGRMRGYEARRRRAGSFVVTREDILERRPRHLTELLHGVPGGTVVPTPPEGYTLLLRSQCRPGIWMDGTEVPGARSLDQMVSPMDVEAVEVFHGFELPVEFGVDTCGGILIWTRRGPTGLSEAGEDGGAGVLGPLIKTAVVVLGFLLLSR